MKGSDTIVVARLRAIFRPYIKTINGRRTSGNDIPPAAYVEFYKPSVKNPAKPSEESHTNIPDHLLHFSPEEGHLMHRFTPSYTASGTMNGAFVPLTDVWRSVQLIPVFGPTCAPHWTSANSMDLAKEFLLNRYDTCHMFQTLREPSMTT